MSNRVWSAGCLLNSRVSILSGGPCRDDGLLVARLSGWVCEGLAPTLSLLIWLATGAGCFGYAFTNTSKPP